MTARGRGRGGGAKAAFILAIASVAGILQGLGVRLLGRTFDPLDFVMYAIGVLSAILLDRVALPALCGNRSARSGVTR